MANYTILLKSVHIGICVVCDDNPGRILYNCGFYYFRCKDCFPKNTFKELTLEEFEIHTILNS